MNNPTAYNFGQAAKAHAKKAIEAAKEGRLKGGQYSHRKSL